MQGTMLRVGCKGIAFNKKENSKRFPYLWYNLLRLLIYIQLVCNISFNVLHTDAKWRLQKVQQWSFLYAQITD